MMEGCCRCAVLLLLLPAAAAVAILQDRQDTIQACYPASAAAGTPQFCIEADCPCPAVADFMLIVADFHETAAVHELILILLVPMYDCWVSAVAALLFLLLEMLLLLLLLLLIHIWTIRRGPSGAVY
jgi:hypothetical protein